MSEKGHFNPQREISKYKLDHSTFDLIDIDKFHNTRFGTVMAYLWSWMLIVLMWVLLGVDVYTCLNILVFHRWSTEEYQPYAYSVAKWIFTGCIIFQFLLVVYHWIWGIHTYRTKNIALVYVNTIARMLYTIKSYNYHCLFHEITHDNFFDRAAFLAYDEVDNSLQVVVADTPRQVINILTLRYYATDGELSNDIIRNIRKIASTNLHLSIILSFMCLSVAIWSFFFVKFCLGILCYLPVIASLRKKGFKSLKKYCCKVVNGHVRALVLKHHKPNNILLEQGILDLSEIRDNPLLNGESTSNFDDDYEYRPTMAAYNDNNRLYNGYFEKSADTLKVEEYPMRSLRGNPTDPFSDDNNMKSTDSFYRNSSIPDSDDVDSDGSGSTKPLAPFGAGATPIYQQAPPPRAYTSPAFSNPFDDPMASQSSLVYDRQPPGFHSKVSSSSLSNVLAGNELQPRVDSLEHKQVKKRPPVPFEDSNASSRAVIKSSTQSSLASEAPYPVRGLSLYDKNHDPQNP